MYGLPGLPDEGLLFGLLPPADLQLLQILLPQLAHRVGLVHQVQETLLVVVVVHQELGLQRGGVLQGALEVYDVVQKVLHLCRYALEEDESGIRLVEIMPTHMLLMSRMFHQIYVRQV